MQVSYDDLEAFVAARGGPGVEYDVADVFADRIEPHVDRIERDAVGNVYATSEGDGDREVMLAAHTDELAALVTEVRDDGFLEFELLGGHYKGYFPGQRFRIGPADVLGVVGAKCRHYMSEAEKESLASADLLLDVGASSAAEVAALDVEAGDIATWDRTVDRLAGDRVTGRALDDRIALAILLAVAREVDPDVTVHYTATVQEEVGLRGAQAAGYAVDPDVAIALEIFPSNDYPAGETERQTVTLDGGPVVEFGDGTSEYMFNGVLVDRQTRSWLTGAADSVDVDVQETVMVGGTTDATAFQQVRGGRHAGAIAVPCRYTHSPVETLSMADADETAAVLAAALSRPFPDRDEIRR